MPRPIQVDTTNPPGRETAAAVVLRDHLEAAGVACELVARDPDRANLVARIRGIRRTARRWPSSGTWTSCLPTRATGPIPPFAAVVDGEASSTAAARST